jgi:hypothetical protein
VRVVVGRRLLGFDAGDWSILIASLVAIGLLVWYF